MQNGQDLHAVTSSRHAYSEVEQYHDFNQDQTSHSKENYGNKY